MSDTLESLKATIATLTARLERAETRLERAETRLERAETRLEQYDIRFLCGRCGEIGHDIEQCVRDASARDADGTPVPVHPDDRFMRSRVDRRFIREQATELWQLAASYLHTQEVIPHMPRCCKYFNDEVVWGKWSGALLWREMAPGALNSIVYKEWWDDDDEPTMTVLMQACREGAPLAHVSTLLAGRPNVNTVDRRGWTALFWACENEREDIVRKLLEANANPNIAAFNVETPCWTPLMHASYHGRAPIVSALISSCANINHVNHIGRNALMWACNRGHVDVVRVLVEARADVNMTSKIGETALDMTLDMARQLGRDDIVAMLVNAGAVRR